jgi:predicted Zn-dependent protease
MTLAPNAGALSPGDYVAGLIRDGRVASVSGNAEIVGGWPAWLGRIALPAAAGAAPVVLDAAWIRQSPDRLLQVLGASALAGDADEAAIFATMRSFRPLQDAKRAAPVPQRLRLQPAPAAGTLRALFPRLGANALSLEETSILNGVDTTATLSAGRWVKSVEPGRFR